MADGYEKVGEGPAFVTKGTQVTFHFFVTKPLGSYSIAGAQTKVVAEEFSGEGIVRNIWADDPEGKTNLRFNVETPDGSFVVVPAAGIVGVVVAD